MKITGKTLMVDFETEVKVGNNDAVELTLIHQAFIGESEDGGVVVDLELGTDVNNIKFLGIEIDKGYKSFKEFKTHLSGLGIDLDKLIKEKIDELNEEEIENKLKLMFKDKFQ